MIGKSPVYTAGHAPECTQLRLVDRVRCGVGSAEPVSPKSSPVASSDHTLHGVPVRGRSWSFFSFVRNDLKAFGHHVLHGDVLFLTSKATSILGMSTRVDILVGVSATSILGMSTRVDILVGVSAVHP